MADCQVKNEHGLNIHRSTIHTKAYLENLKNITALEDTQDRKWQIHWEEEKPFLSSGSRYYNTAEILDNGCLCFYRDFDWGTKERLDLTSSDPELNKFTIRQNPTQFSFEDWEFVQETEAWRIADQ